MKTTKAIMIAVLLILASLVLFTNTAYGITGNLHSDSTPYIGVVVLFSDTARQVPVGYCSGFLISPTVMVTAGHSLVNVKAVSVCFDQGPISYAFKDGTIIYYGTETVHNGVPVQYPRYVPSMSGNQEFATSDIGLILLDTPVSDVTVFPTLPKVGFADTISAKTDLQVVGYGVQYQATPRNNGVMNSWTGTLSRNTAQTELLSTHFAGSDKYLKLSANTAQGQGGIAFGDSGGPVIYQADKDSPSMVLAINAYVANSNCAGVTYHTRIDTTQVLAWIKGFL